VPGRATVAVVSKLFEDTFFSGERAVGRHLTLEVPTRQDAGLPAGSRRIDIEIVGVAATARYGDLRDRTPPVVYLPYGQITFPAIGQMTFALRTTGDPLSIVPAVRRVVQHVDSQMPVTNVRTQEVEIERTINQEILFARLCSAFALLALLIACVGLYGTMAYSVARRTNEIGLRIALGIAWLIRAPLGVLAGAYLALLLMYSALLKHLVIVDVLTIAAGFVFRAAAGAVAVSVPIGSWLLVCTTLLALFLALSKRRHELVLLGDGASRNRYRQESECNEKF